MWAGISLKGRTGICIFEGIMKKELYVDILEKTPIPFVRDIFPEAHRFMLDNDPKYTSGLAREFFEANLLGFVHPQSLLISTQLKTYGTI